MPLPSLFVAKKVRHLELNKNEPWFIELADKRSKTALVTNPNYQYTKFCIYESFHGWYYYLQDYFSVPKM